MDQLKSMKEQLTSIVQGQLSNSQNVDTKELGEAVDMIKDLAEAIYYCSITDAMEEGSKKESKEFYYYTPMVYPREEYTDKMYYGNRNNPVYYGGGQPNQNGPSYGNYGMNYYRERQIPYYEMMPRDPREGRSPIMRRNYMESQQMHQDQAKKMKELEKYIQELSSDITEMIADATPEEKMLLKQKISILSDKIA